MILRKKTLLICLMLIGLLGVLYAFSRVVLLRSFANLEDQDIRQNVDRATSVLSDDLSNLDRTVSDYSSWDQTYSFVKHPNPDYVKSELPTQTFANDLRVNVVAVMDSSDRIVFAKAVDFATGKDVAFPQSLRENLVPNAPLLRHANTKSKALGTILLPEGPLLLVSRPILTSADEGPIRGTFIMGRWLDAGEVQHLAEISHLSITLSRFGAYAMPSDWPMLHADASGQSLTVVRALSSQHTAGYRLLKDLYGKPALILRVDMPRRIYQQGQASLLHFTLVFLTTGLVFGAMILFLLETIERSHEERYEKETRLHLLINQVPAVLWTTDTALHFTSLQGAGLKAFGLKPNQLVGLSLPDYFQANGPNSLLIAGHQRALREKSGTYQHEWEARSFHSHVEPLLTVDGTIAGTIGLALDITERKRAEALLIGEKRVLEMITKGDSLASVAGIVARTVEEQSAGIFCSVSFLEPDGKTLRQVAAPSLPETYTREIGGLKIGPSVGSCGTAAYTGKPVIVSNIARDPLWADYHELALSHELRACWSVPIISTKGKVLGTIAVYCSEPRPPSGVELDVIERAADLVAIVTERKQVEQELVHNALHDSLTNMPNRVSFLDHLQREVVRTKHDPSRRFAVLFVDIDDFKKVNDSLGHSIGDQLISEIGLRLTRSLRGSDTISRPIATEGPEKPKGENTLARLGGDEFTVLLVDIKDPSDVIRAAKRIQSILAIPFTLSGQEVFVSASVGIALSTTPHSTAKDLLRDADIAMYRAKSLGKARFEMFDTAMHVQAVNRLKLEGELQRAVEREEFRLFYQPIISLHGGRITGFEALLRWQPPNQGLVGPAEFIGVAEETGLILPIGKWVLNQACQQARLWQTQYPSDPPLTISVNISAKQFTQSNLAEEIQLVLEQTGLPPSSLELEITETVAMEDTERATNILSRLKALGVRLAIDDFGTGYSSLNYLRRLPFDTLKIDRSFISNMGGGNDSRDIVAIIVMLARNLGLHAVAEGLETAEHVNHLQELNCEFGQGYFFSKPTDEETMGKLLLGSRHGEGNFVGSALVRKKRGAAQGET